MKRSSVLIALLSGLAGCADLQSSQLAFWNAAPLQAVSTEQQKHIPAPTHGVTIARQKAAPPRLAQRDLSLGGAAYRQEGYVHVLDNRKTLSSASKPDPARPMVIKHSGTQPHKHSRQSSSSASSQYNDQKGYSIYELERWKRYCNRGKDMGAADLRFVQRAGIANVPSAMSATCQPPSFSLSDYTQAWEQYCRTGQSKLREYEIIARTQMPAQLRGACDRKGRTEQ